MKLSKKIRLWLAAAMAIPAGMSAQEQILAFPGAEGFGKYRVKPKWRCMDFEKSVKFAV